MANGLSRYLAPDDQAQISMEDLMMASDPQAMQQANLMDALTEEFPQADPGMMEAPTNPMSQAAVPEMLLSKDIAQLYDQKAKEAMLQEQQGLSQLEQYIQDYQKSDRGIDWTAAAALFPGNPQLMQAAKSMQPETQDQRNANILGMQQKLQAAKHQLTTGQLSGLGQQLKMQMSAQAEGERRERDRQRLAMEKQRSDAWEKYKALELKIRGDEVQARRSGADERQQIGLDQKEQARLDNDVQKLEKRVGDMVPGIVTKMENLDALIPGGIEGDDESPVPGTGPGQFLIPDVMLSNEASDIQQNARGLMADLIKLQSGTAASDQEVARKMKERGMGPGSKSATFKKGLRLLKQEIGSVLKNKETGFRPEVKSLYQERGGITHETILSFGKKAKAPAGPVPSFEEWKASKAKGP